MLSYNHFLLESKRKSIRGFDQEIRYIDRMVSDARKHQNRDQEKSDSYLEKALKTIRDIYSSILPTAEKTEKELQSFLKDISRKEKIQNPKILTRIKPIKSVINKVVERGKDFSTMGDLVGAAILTRDDDEPEKIYKNLLRKYRSKIVDAETKERGSDRTYGYYGSYHLDMLINGMVTEVQIMTRKLWSYKKAAHDIYTATRAKQELSRFDQALSKKLFSMGNMPSYVREYVEMYDIDDVSLLEEIFEKNYVETT